MHRASHLSIAGRSFCSAAKEFKDIPGPKGWLGMGTIIQYWPTIGRYDWDALHETGMKKFQEYGEIVKERMLPGVDVVWLFNPDDIGKVLNDSGPQMYPQRKSHLALQKFRKDRPHVYNTGGLLPTNGEEWWKLRSELQKGLSSPKHVRTFLPKSDRLTRDFVADIRTVDDFQDELARLNLELVCLLAFDARLDSLSEIERHPESISSKLIQAAEITNSCILPTDQGFQLWRFFDTPQYMRLKKAQLFMEDIAVDLVAKKIEYYEEKNLDDEDEVSSSLLEEYLKNPSIDLKDIVGMAADLLLAGVDTTTYSTCFALYHLARNKPAQQRLYEEALKLLPDPFQKLTANAINSEATYTRAVLKESLRLNPISIGVGRNLNTDLILSGFKVPKGTVTVTQNLVACRLEKHFEDALNFVPERWLKNDGEKLNIHPYLVQPFGHGMRACIARRFAEQNILVLLLRLIRHYEIDWQGTEMNIKTHLINKPDQAIRLSFKKRF